MLRRSSAFLLGIFAVSQVGFANPCRKLDRRSCWHVINNSKTQSLSLHCTGFSSQSFNFSTHNLAPGQVYSYQFNLSWGDGLGFPEPNVRVQCEAKYKNAKGNAHFSTQDWGERAKFEVNEKELVLTRKGWSSTNRITKHPMSKMFVENTDEKGVKTL